MHYANGRQAKNGDKVMVLPDPKYPNVTPTVGILYDATAGNDYCNGKIAVIRSNDPCPNLKDCLHADDARAVIGEITQAPDTSKPE